MITLGIIIAKYNNEDAEEPTFSSTRRTFSVFNTLRMNSVQVEQFVFRDTESQFNFRESEGSEINRKSSKAINLRVSTRVSTHQRKSQKKSFRSSQTKRSFHTSKDKSLRLSKDSPLRKS